MKNIHVLPTDKPSRLINYLKDNGWDLFNNPMPKVDCVICKNIYINSNEEPKLDEWGVNIKNSVIFKCKGFSSTEETKKFHKKIIMTTDTDLIKDGVEIIPDEFLEWFIKNPSCEYVEVKEDKCGWFVNGGKDVEYRKYNYIEVPKEETLEEAINREFPLDKSYKEREAMFIGVKWQQGRSYSEEEIMEMFDKFSMHLPLHYKFLVKEQFKKK